jgi:hypothetical protein
MTDNKLPYCPFYRKDNFERLYCEGATVKFPDREARIEIVEEFCCSEVNHKNCPIYKMMVNYYDRKYEEYDIVR